MNNLKFFLKVTLVSSLFFFLLFVGISSAHDKHENAECQVNNSDKQCQEGLVCVPFNEESDNGKCEEPSVTPEVTQEATPSATLTPDVTESPKNDSLPGDGHTESLGCQHPEDNCNTYNPNATSPYDGTQVIWK